jgi:CheY-like chemotaxis protein
MSEYKNSILFIDDDEIHNFVMKSYLDHLDAHVNSSFLVSAEKALDLLDDMNYEDWPTIIVVDLKMPIMQGVEFLQKLQTNHPKCNEHTCVVVLTASVSPIDKEEANKFPIVSQYLVKPLNSEAIEKMISTCLSSFSTTH